MLRTVSISWNRNSYTNKLSRKYDDDLFSDASPYSYVLTKRRLSVTITSFAFSLDTTCGVMFHGNLYN